MCPVLVKTKLYPFLNMHTKNIQKYKTVGIHLYCFIFPAVLEENYIASVLDELIILTKSIGLKICTSFPLCVEFFKYMHACVSFQSPSTRKVVIIQVVKLFLVSHGCIGSLHEYANLFAKNRATLMFITVKIYCYFLVVLGS